MIGLDSNVLLRSVLNDDPVWGEASYRFIAKHCTEDEPGYVNPIVLAEICWTLRRRTEFTRAKLADFIEGLLEADNIELAEQDKVVRALARFRNGPAGFVDYLIAELNSAVGAADTYTIDKDAVKSGAFKPIPMEDE